MSPGEQGVGPGATFDACRAAFGEAWARILANRTEADFEAWRRQRAFAAWKYQMHDIGAPLPTQLASGRSRCFCGAEITIRSLDDHVVAAHRDMT
jgi:hypothetical protein